MSLLAWIEVGLVASGAALMLLAAVGVVRMPDLFLRMQAATKASSLGAGLMLAGVALHFHDLAVVTRAVAIAAFIFITTPVAAHLVARAAYHAGVPLWERTLVDELRDRFEGTGPQASPPAPPREGDEESSHR